MRITLRQIEIFVMVAEHLHFGRAAEALHISQPTVSQEVGRLERALGLALFDRTRRSASLTPAGESMVEEGRRLLSQADHLVSKVRLYEESRMKTIRVAATPSVVNRLLPAVISRCERELPGLDIEDIAVETGAVSPLLSAGHGDIGLGRFLDPIEGFRTEVITDEEILVALSRNHPCAGAARISLDELHDLPLLLWSREQHPQYYDYVRAICVERGLNPMVLVSPPRIVGSRQYLLSEARAFSLVPRSAVGHLSDDLRTVSLQKPATLPLEMQWRDDDPRPYARALCELIADEAAALA
ncbi:LysR family transcriptional regulator [Streptomyces sp. SID10853]|uniref:LysR family transcriptional regulator n=1 Tax=Streptomyces sp. SID10853 TaxID=2706028 RepID=UPI0013C105D6|nr:LysR substrate-binding domain-containing protein [Streptomyces sp. SID10853]NDZ79521.1 LysR family transcriptional regulator [Streptomyces sp. SID10853]